MNDIDFNSQVPLHEERDRQIDAEIEAMLLEALDTPVLPLTDREFDEIRNDGLKILDELKRQ